MEEQKRSAISIEAIVHAPIGTAWEYWTNPEHFKQWCYASNDWYARYVENDLRVNGNFKTTMAAKDGSVSFHLQGLYTDVEYHKLIKYELDDGRQVSYFFVI